MTTYYPSHVVLRDPALPHQIVIDMVQGGPLIYVSCNCRRSPAGGHMPLESRVRWKPGEILAAYRAHLPG